MAHPCADARYDPREPSLDWVLARAARADRVPATVDAGPKAGDAAKEAEVADAAGPATANPVARAPGEMHES